MTETKVKIARILFDPALMKTELGQSKDIPMVIGEVMRRLLELEDLENADEDNDYAIISPETLVALLTISGWLLANAPDTMMSGERPLMKLVSGVLVRSYIIHAIDAKGNDGVSSFICEELEKLGYPIKYEAGEWEETEEPIKSETKDHKGTVH